jgi:hypothetical protein
MRIGTRRAPMLDAALRYAAFGWPVAPAFLPRAEIVAAATTARSAIEQWWRSRPGAGIVLATGGPVDALGVPADVGRAALARLQATGLAVGPVASVRDRCYFLVAGGGRSRFGVHQERLGEPRLDLTYHGEGDAVPLPPSYGQAEPVRWEVDPVSSIMTRGQALPSAAELHGTIAYVALEPALSLLEPDLPAREHELLA